MLTKQDVVNYAKSFGADLVGITSLDRFEGAVLLLMEAGYMWYLIAHI